MNVSLVTLGYSGVCGGDTTAYSSFTKATIEAEYIAHKHNLELSVAHKNYRVYLNSGRPECGELYKITVERLKVW